MQPVVEAPAEPTNVDYAKTMTMPRRSASKSPELIKPSKTSEQDETFSFDAIERIAKERLSDSKGNLVRVDELK